MSFFGEVSQETWKDICDKAEANRPSAGKTVKVVSGKHRGTIGLVTWHGRDKFASGRYQSDLDSVVGREGWRIKITTEDGASFFANAEYAEVVKWKHS